MAQVEGQRVLAAVTDQEVPALAAAERGDVAARLALEGLDLDHVGTAVGEHLSRPWHGDEVAEFEHRDAGERLVSHVFTWGAPTLPPHPPTLRPSPGNPGALRTLA